MHAFCQAYDKDWAELLLSTYRMSTTAPSLWVVSADTSTPLAPDYIQTMRSSTTFRYMAHVAVPKQVRGYVCMLCVLVGNMVCKGPHSVHAANPFLWPGLHPLAPSWLLADGMTSTQVPPHTYNRGTNAGTQALLGYLRQVDQHHSD